MHGRRDNIHKARIKIIVNQMGIDKYRELVDKDWEFTKNGALQGPRRRRSRASTPTSRRPQYEKLADETQALAKIRSGDRAFDRWMRGNVIEHKVPGYAIVNMSLKAPGKVPGDITADKMDAVADLADRYSFGEIRVTPPPEPRARRRQAVASSTELWHKLTALELATPNLGLLTDIICCPGLDYCALANARSIPIAQDISHAFTDLDELQKIGQFTINISGCMNACGHHHVGHIGILGVDKRGEEFFQLTLGGSSDQHASLGDRLGPGLPQAEVPAAIRKIVDTYLVDPAAERALPRHVSARRHRAVQGGRLRRRKPGGLMALVKNGELVDELVRRRERRGSHPAPRGPSSSASTNGRRTATSCLKRGTPLGIRLHSDQPPELVAADLPHFAARRARVPEVSRRARVFVRAAPARALRLQGRAARRRRSAARAAVLHAAHGLRYVRHRRARIR